MNKARHALDRGWEMGEAMGGAGRDKRKKDKNIRGQKGAVEKLTIRAMHLWVTQR
jgi:hypothetical protein